MNQTGKESVTRLPVPLTAACEQLGWRGERTDFDLLPLIFRMRGDEQPVWYELPRSLVIEVPLHILKSKRFQIWS